MSDKTQKKDQGRPPKADEEKLSVRMSIGMTSEEYTTFGEFAKKHDMQMAYLFRLAAKEFIKRVERKQ